MLSPAQYVVNEFTGIRPLARAINISPSSICRWLKPRADGGCDGEIPTRNHRKILDAALKHNIKLDRARLVCAA